MPNRRSTHESLPRLMIETLAFLIMTVSLFRTFVAEGFMISTGSMAPTLWGYHKRVICPHCESLFALGVPHVGSIDNEAARCPMCSAYPIDVSQLRRIEGDQIIVHKHAYEVRPPRRYEVVVFRHPEDLQQAYVKRVIGLPGESVELRGGNVYIDGELARKPHEVNLASRILVDDQSVDVAENDPDWRRRWSTISPERAVFDETSRTWQLTSPDTSSPASITFRNWQRRHMMTTSKVPLSVWPAALLTPDAYHMPLSFDAKTAALQCRGSLPFQVADDLIHAAQTENVDGSFVQSVKDLFRLSHLTPITDQYAYNRQTYNLQPYEVEDVTLATTLVPISMAGTVLFQLENSAVASTLVLNLSEKSAVLEVSGETRTTHALPDLKHAGPFEIELSLVDGQVAVVLDHQVVAQVAFDPEFDRPQMATKPADSAVGAVRMEITLIQGSVQLTALRVFRDLYYRHQTAARTQPDSAPRTWKLGSEELFLMGDNSPISLDSRSWQPETVHTSDLIGKPLFLHLPSRPGQLSFGGKDLTIRLPDIPRMKIIH